MKSGPTLADATRRPRAAHAAMRPVATVVFPTPEWVPETTILGPSVGTVHPRADGAAGSRGAHRLAAALRDGDRLRPRVGNAPRRGHPRVRLAPRGPDASDRVAFRAPAGCRAGRGRPARQRQRGQR